jgi:hypothetical protein
VRHRLVVGLAALFLVVQIAVPIWMLFEPRPARVGWQMYSGARSLPEVVIVGEDGAEQVVDIIEYLAEPRAEIDYAARFAEQGCRLFDAVVVRVKPVDGPAEEVECE